MPEPTKVFPETVVPLLSGASVVVKPWSLANGRIQRQRITSIVDQLSKNGDGKISLTSAFDQCEKTVEEIVRDTIGVDDAWMEANLAYEDLYTLAQAVIKVCLLRGGDGGVLGKLLGAMGMKSEAALAPELKARIEAVRAAASLPGFETPPKPTEP